MNLMQANRQWATRPADQRYETLAALTEAVSERRNRSRSVDLDLSKIEAGEQSGTIILNHGMKAVEPTHWSFSQLAGWVHAPAEYLRRIPQPLAVQCLNHGLKDASQERGALKFMAVTRPDDPNGINQLQAVTSTTYGRIWDADVCQCAGRIVEKTGGRFFNPKAYDPATGQPKPSGLYASDRDVFIFMIDGGSFLDAGPRAQLNRGFFMWNSETGSRTFGLTTFWHNGVCGNHIVWGATDVREITIRHTAGGPYRFDSDAAPALLSYATASVQKDLEAVKKAQGYLLPEGRDETVDWTMKHGKFSRFEVAQAIDTAKKEEGDCRTLWHMVQGLTAYARGFDYVDARVDLETRAGKLMEVVAGN